MSDLRCARGCTVVATLSDGVFTTKRARRRNEDGSPVLLYSDRGIDVARRAWCPNCGGMTFFGVDGEIVEAPIEGK